MSFPCHLTQRIAELTGIQRYERFDDIERVVLSWRTTILNMVRDMMPEHVTEYVI